MKLTQKAVSSVHRVLIYGPPKTGKTQLAGALSQYKNLLWFDLENGYTTLLKFPEEWKERIEIISLPDTRSFPVAIETCLKVIRGGPTDICEEHGKVNCPSCKKDGKPTITVELNKLGEDTVVVFDSLTQLTASAIAHITKGKPEDYKMEFDDWGNLGKLMEIFLSHIQQAPFNVVCISHETETELEDGKLKLVPVAGSRAFSRNTAKYFDHVVYAEVKNKKHSLVSSTVGSLNLNTGSRTGVDLATNTDEGLIQMFRSPASPSQNDKATAQLKDLQTRTTQTGTQVNSPGVVKPGSIHLASLIKK